MGAFLALVLSFFIPGLGQFYNGQALKGALVFFAAIILGVISGGILGIPVWLYGMFDAYSVANEPKVVSQSQIVTHHVSQNVNIGDVAKESKVVPVEKPENYQEVCPKCEGVVTITGKKFICQGCGTKFTDMEAAWKYQGSNKATPLEKIKPPELGPDSRPEDMRKRFGGKAPNVCPFCAGKISDLLFYKLKAGESVRCEYCEEIIEG